MANFTNRRRTVIVNRQLQRKIILGVALSPSIAVTGAALLVAIFCRRLQGEAMVADVQLPSLMPLFGISLVFTVLAAIGIVYQALHFSHRIAGPAYRFIQSMARIRSGDIGFRVRLRKGDNLTEVADEMNALLDWLNENPPSVDGLRTDAVVQGEVGITAEESPAPLPVGPGAEPLAGAAAESGQRQLESATAD